MPDPPTPLEARDWNDHTPLNVIGLPHYTSSLLSNIPDDHWITEYSPMFSARPPLDPLVLQNMQLSGSLGFATNPGHIRRNQVASIAHKKLNRRKLDVPSFKSQKQRQKLTKDVSLQDANADSESTKEAAKIGETVKWYRKVEIKYSKFGVEDFDFGCVAPNIQLRRLTSLFQLL